MLKIINADLQPDTDFIRLVRVANDFEPLFMGFVDNGLNLGSKSITS